jgi:hypothetical protein
MHENSRVVIALHRQEKRKLVWLATRFGDWLADSTITPSKEVR